MNKYIIHLSSGVLCLLGGFMLFVGLFFDASDIHRVRGQVVSSQVIPGTSVVAGPLPSSASCEEVFFCKHSCTSGNGLDCIEYCAPGQVIGSSCVGSNNQPGVCVGICSSTFQSTTAWTSCNQQPTDPLNCPLGDTCIGFAPQQTVTGGMCQQGCGVLHMSTGATGTVLTGGSTGLCTGSSQLITGSLVQTPTGWIWGCSGNNLIDAFSGSSKCFMDVPGSGGTIAGGTTSGQSRSGGKPSSIPGGRIIPKKNSGTSKSVVTPMQQHFSDALRSSLERFDSSCAYTDIDYHSLMFQDIQWNPDQEAIKTLQAYCIVKGYTLTQNTKYHTDSATSIGEAIKVLTKIIAMDEGVSFDEFGWYQGRLPYADMLPNAWYTPYVVYADELGYLEGISSWKMFGRGELKAYTPITKKQFAQLLDNYGKDSSVYQRYFSESGKYVMRDDMADIVVDAFSDELIDYSYLYGNNTLFYRRLLARLEKKTNQKAYLENLLQNMQKRDADLMGWKYNLDVEGIIAFLHELIRENQ